MAISQNLQNIIERSSAFCADLSQHIEKISQANSNNAFFSSNESKHSDISEALNVGKEEVSFLLVGAASENASSQSSQAQSMVEEALQTIQNDIYSSI